MSATGDQLRQARENRKLSISRAAEDTNIGPAYLEGLEKEDYTGFPGEPYIIGFLRNYAEYLGIDPEALIRDYKAVHGASEADAVVNYREPQHSEPPKKPKKERRAPESASIPGIRVSPDKFLPDNPLSGNGSQPQSGQETVPPPAQEVPVDAESYAGTDTAFPENQEKSSAATQSSVPLSGESGPASPARKILTPATRSPGAGRKTLVPVLAGIVILILAAAVFFVVRGKMPGGGSTVATRSAVPVEYKIEGSAFEKRIYPGDSILATVDLDTYKIKLAGIDESVNLETPIGPMKLQLAEEINVDFNRDNIPELKLSVGDFSKKDPASGVLIRVEYVNQKPADSTSATEIKVGPDDIQSAEPTAQKSGVLFRSGKGPYPFVITVSFRNACMLRYEADRREWKERYYSKGETITVNADNSIVVWASNAQAAKITVMASGGKTADLELGGPGEVAVKRIGWSQSEGSWVLSAVETD